MRKSSPMLLVCVFLLLSSGITPAQVRTRTSTAKEQDAKANKAGPPCAATDSTVISGLVVDIVPKQDGSLDLRSVKNPCISGVALQIHWSDLEPVQGKPDWSKLDEFFSSAESSKKWVHLEIFPGFFAPAWAKEGLKTGRVNAG